VGRRGSPGLPCLSVSGACQSAILSSRHGIGRVTFLEGEVAQQHRPCGNPSLRGLFVGNRSDVDSTFAEFPANPGNGIGCVLVVLSLECVRFILANDIRYSTPGHMCMSVNNNVVRLDVK
jgi:hypothetical protein